LTTKIGWILAKVEVALPFVHQALRARLNQPNLWKERLHSIYAPLSCPTTTFVISPAPSSTFAWHMHTSSDRQSVFKETPHPFTPFCFDSCSADGAPTLRPVWHGFETKGIQEACRWR